jgi:translocator protein
MRSLGRLVISLALCQAPGIIGAFFTSAAIPTWYAELVKPSFNPPNWLFGPVWTLLYLLMGCSLYLLWNADKSRDRDRALILFVAQLILNALWSIIFFGLKMLLFAFVEIVMLWALIVATIYYSYRVDRRSAYTLLPYIAWVSFAAILNLSLFMLNR